MTGARPLSVLVVHNRYRSEQPSGEDRVVDQEVDLLARGGHRVALFERRSDDIAAMPVYRRAMVPLLVPWNPAARTELADRLRADRPDVVHLHSTFPLLSPSVVDACAEAGVPVVATLHNYLPVCPTGTLYRDGEICTDCVGRTGLPAVRHGCYRGSALASVPVALGMTVAHRRWSKVARYFCISRSQRELLVAAGMPAGQLVVKHNFVEEPPVRRTGPGEYLLFLGRLTEEKGIGLLMRAWDRLAADGGVGMPLVIVGAGPSSEAVARWAHGRTDVRFAGLQDRAGCARMVAGAAAVLAPSMWLEAFGLVVVEAMAAGVPAVAAAHGAFVELIEDGVDGLLHRPGDVGSLARSLREIVADRERNRRLGEAARARYERTFTAEVGLAGLVAGYRDAMAHQGAGTRT